MRGNAKVQFGDGCFYADLHMIEMTMALGPVDLGALRQIGIKLVTPSGDSVTAWMSDAQALTLGAQITKVLSKPIEEPTV